MLVTSLVKGRSMRSGRDGRERLEAFVCKQGQALDGRNIEQVGNPPKPQPKPRVVHKPFAHSYATYACVHESGASDLSSVTQHMDPTPLGEDAG